MFCIQQVIKIVANYRRTEEVKTGTMKAKRETSTNTVLSKYDISVCEW